MEIVIERRLHHGRRAVRRIALGEGAPRIVGRAGEFAE